MMNQYNISLQINVSAADLRICRQMLERQISFWYEELDEVVISVESKKSFGKFAVDFDKNKSDLLTLIDQYIRRYPKVRYHFIDYSPERQTVLSRRFFKGDWMPLKDYRGCAFYSYIDGLARCKNKYIVHLDSDMLIGGTPNTWLQDAVELLNSDEKYLLVNPLAGPPSADFDIKQKYLKKIGKYSFLFDKMSTRVFVIDMEKLALHGLPLKRVPFSPSNVKWSIKNNFNWGYMALEDLFSVMMRKNGLLRVDTLGKNGARSAFSIHPVNKPEQYINAIPELLKRIDADDIPDAQRGNYNVHNDFFNFQAAK
jgi:hypothetical protein